MIPFNIDCPCSPGDKIYWIGPFGEVKMLFVRKIKVHMSTERCGSPFVTVHFENHPYLFLDEIEGRIFDTKEEAKAYAQKYR